MLSPGISVGRYVVQRKLAEGGMAEIYLASAVGPEGFAKDVVLKVVRSFLASDQQFVQLFIAEARLASRLNHANVVQIFDFGKHDETYYLAMEYVRGASLWDLRKRCREFGVPFPATLAAEIGAQLARGLHYAHSLSEGGQRLGVVHRDVTPHNILLSFDGAVKLTDFGIAKAASTQTVPGMIKGKFAYMSPEQGRGDRVDARTDVFALGIVLWELLTGGRLFDGDSDVAVLRSVQESLIAPPARLNPDVAQDLSDIVMKALERNVDERFGSAAELEKALATWVLRNATAVEETSVSTFLEQLYREEVEQPALVAAAPMDDFGVGSTLFVDRSGPLPRSADSSMPTMTSTPVQGAPAGAMPKQARGALHDDEPRPRRTEQMPGLRPSVRLPVSTEPGSPEPRDATEQQPAFKPAPVSRRFDPLPVQEPSLVQLAPGEADSPMSTTSTPSISHTEPAAEDELPRPARSKGPLIALGVALLGVVAGVAALGLETGEQQPTQVVVGAPRPRATLIPAEASTPSPEPLATASAVAPAPPEVGMGVDAGTIGDARPPVAPGTQVEGSAPLIAGRLVDAGEKPTPVAAPRFGTLSVKAVPFALVSANGRPLGEVTGSRTFRLAARTWEIEFVKNKVRRKMTVTVKPNEETAVEFNGE